MTKLICFVMVILFAFSSTYTLASHKTIITNDKKSTKHRKTRYMFIVSSKTGYIKHISKNHYQLRLQVPDVHQVLMFSDRPYRIVAYISGNVLKTIWTKGKNNFIVDPPNAVLSANGLYPTITVLHRYENHGDHIIFDFFSTQLINFKTLHYVTLTIDSSIETMQDLTQGTQIAAAKAKQEKCTDVTNDLMSSSLVITPIPYIASAIACGGSSGIKNAFNPKTTTTTTSNTPNIITYKTATNPEEASIKAEQKAEADESTTCKDITNFAGNMESMQSPVGDLASVIACGSGSPLTQTTAKKYEDL